MGGWRWGSGRAGTTRSTWAMDTSSRRHRCGSGSSKRVSRSCAACGPKRSSPTKASTINSRGRSAIRSRYRDPSRCGSPGVGRSSPCEWPPSTPTTPTSGCGSRTSCTRARCLPGIVRTWAGPSMTLCDRPCSPSSSTKMHRLSPTRSTSTRRGWPAWSAPRRRSGREAAWRSTGSSAPRSR